MIRSAQLSCQPSVARRVKAAAGFSLIELLVAVLVIVLLTTVVSLNVGSGGGDISRASEVSHLAALLGYVQGEAELSGVDHGLYLERTNIDGDPRYTAYWLRRYDQGWAAPRSSADVLEPMGFEPGVELELALVGDPEVLITERDPELNPTPQILLFASGEITEGELDWIDRQTGDLLFRLRWDLFGRTTLMPKGRESDTDAN